MHIDPRFDIHKVEEDNENDMRIETGSSILDDTSTLAGSILFAGGSDTSTLQGEILAAQANDQLNEGSIRVDEVMKQLDSAIRAHQDEDDYSIRSVSSILVPNKTNEPDVTDNRPQRKSANLIVRENLQDPRDQNVRIKIVLHLKLYNYYIYVR